jgi:uncharacterized membrane protein
MTDLLAAIAPLDWVAAAWFLGAWIGYGWVADRSRLATRGLLGAMHQYRLIWARQLFRRENRVADAALVGNLMRSVSFYANTTIYIVAGLLALLGALDKVISATAALPFAGVSSRSLWEIKLLLLLAVFVVGYFNFTWSLRLFNLLSILIGAAPVDMDEGNRDALRMARINSMAGDEFNRGIRAYYFGLAAVTWFIQPWLFIAMTSLIVVVLYRRDFASPALRVLQEKG